MLENPFITVFFHLTYLSVLVQCILYNNCYIKGASMIDIREWGFLLFVKRTGSENY